jgi:fumarylacetoacetate (FAA) hydrolase family protein
MKYFIAVFFLTIGISSFCQVTDRMQEKKDSISKVIKKELGISQVKADSLSAILAWSSNSMVAIVKDRSLPKEESLNRIKRIAAERDKKIDALLTAVQVEKLKAIMAAHKQNIIASQKLPAQKRIQ